MKKTKCAGCGKSNGKLELIEFTFYNALTGKEEKRTAYVHDEIECKLNYFDNENK